MSICIPASLHSQEQAADAAPQEQNEEAASQQQNAEEATKTSVDEQQAAETGATGTQEAPAQADDARAGDEQPSQETPADTAADTDATKDVQPQGTADEDTAAKEASQDADTTTDQQDTDTANGGDDTYYGGVSEDEMSEYRDNLDEINKEQEEEIVKLDRPVASAKRHEKRMRFQFDNTPLSDIVQEFAKKRGLNIVLPHGDEAITQKVSFKQEKPISLSRAERYIHMLLDLAGYRMHPHGSYYIVTKHQQDHQMRKSFPVYVNVPPDELPQTQADIHAIYSLVNLRVPEQGKGGPIDELLKSTLSHQKTYMFDPQSNSIIITDSAENVAATMKILLALDASDSPEMFQPIQLYNSSAQTVAKLLNEQIIAQTQGQRGNKNQQRLSSTQYFAPNMHVVADTRRNRLLLLGRSESIHRITNFIQEELDAPVESGKSILHVYELQYLDAKDFAPVLQKIVQPVGAKGGQAEKEGATGATRYFEDVKIIAEPEQQIEAQAAQEGTQQKKRLSIGGNRLVVAATSDDWERIKRIIADLDKPQKQVIIEVMIADVQGTSNKSLGAQTRNPNSVDLPDDVTFQASHLSSTGPILSQQDPKTLMSDLLRLIDGQSFASNAITTPGESGAMLLSIADPYDSNKIWSLFKVLDKYVERKVLSHPFLVTRDNVQAQAKNINIRRARGDLAQGASQSVSPTIDIEDFKAKLIVNVTPRVSSQERLNLQIDIDIEDFLGETGLDRVNRKVVTNANMQTGQVLVLGGLTRTTENTTHRKTPLLGDLPVIGQFFRSQSKTHERTNLVVFLTPTIVEPKLDQGIHRYTNDQIEARYQEAQGAVFDNLHQPITHFFFSNMGRDETPLDNYLDEVQYKQQQMELDQDYAYASEYEIMKAMDNYEDAQQLKNKFQSSANPLHR